VPELTNATWRQGVEALHETTTGTNESGGNFSLQRTLLVTREDAFGNETFRRKVRLTIRVDVFHPFESAYRAEAWDGQQWREVVRVEGVDPNYEPVGVKSVVGKRAYVDGIAEDLLERAMAVLA
jgi:hypothetical protein